MLFVDSYAASQALGEPDVYPQYGPIIHHWAAKPQNGHEYIAVSLTYSAPAMVDFVMWLYQFESFQSCYLIIPKTVFAVGW